MRGDFRIDKWLVQPQLNTIIGPDHAVLRVEPKVMELLTFLADHADEVLPKERILQEVWPDAFVTEDALMHGISELRKAFGDDARDPRYIQTIQKRGYRLIAPVSKFKGPARRYKDIHDVRTDLQSLDAPSLVEGAPARQWQRLQGPMQPARRGALPWIGSRDFIGGPLGPFDLSQDGQRFLTVKREDPVPQPAAEMILVERWFQELRRLCP